MALDFKFYIDSLFLINLKTYLYYYAFMFVYIGSKLLLVHNIIKEN